VLSLQISVGIMFERLDMTVINRHLDFLVGQREISLPKSIGPYQSGMIRSLASIRGRSDLCDKASTKREHF